jgi:hypothetical protein
LAGLLGGIDDGLVAGATAQIAAERIGDVQALGLGLDFYEAGAYVHFVVVV